MKKNLRDMNTDVARFLTDEDAYIPWTAEQRLAAIHLVAAGCQGYIMSLQDGEEDGSLENLKEHLMYNMGGIASLVSDPGDSLNTMDWRTWLRGAHYYMTYLVDGRDFYEEEG